MKPWKELLKTKKFWILTLIGVFLVAGIPIIINELYKANKGYITVWNGADVLSYYGTILGAVATIWVLGSTISFTRRQLRYDRFMQSELRRWQRLEKLSTKAIETVVPTKLHELFVDVMSKQPDRFIPPDLKRFPSYAQIALNTLSCSLSKEDRDILSPFLDALESLCDELTDIANQFHEIAVTMKKIFTEKQTPESPAEFNKASALSFELIDKLFSLQSNEYMNLLRLQRECFSKAHSVICTKADMIL